MYCINCGVKLADTETECPLCHTAVFHPDITREKGEELYPPDKYPAAEKRIYRPQIFMTAIFLLPMIITALCDLQFNDGITWSGYALGAIALAYVILILPSWFSRPNPVIFVPCGFAATAVYLLYINLTLDGDWFLSFAFPITGGVGLIVTAIVALTWYLKRGRLFIFGGAFVLFGAFMLLIEFLTNLTFHFPEFIGWSLYPLVTFVLLGGTLIFLGINRPARETMERKFFI